MDSKLPPMPDRQPLLDATGRALRGAVELKAVARVALDAVVPGLADLAVLVVTDTEGVPRVEAAHVRPSMVPLLEREVRGAMEPIVRVATASARSGRHARWVPTVSDTSARFVTHGDSRLVYRGRLDDRVVGPGRTRPHPTRFDLREAIALTLAGRFSSLVTTPAFGCEIADVR